MNGVTIYKCSSGFGSAWWQGLEKAGLTVERTHSQGIVSSGKAKVAVHILDGDNLMIVFSAPFVFWGKNLRLAKRIEEEFLKHCKNNHARGS